MERKARCICHVWAEQLHSTKPEMFCPPPLLQDLGHKPLGATSALHVIEDTIACISHGKKTQLQLKRLGEGASMGRVSMGEMEFCLVSPLSPLSVSYSVHL